MPISETLAPPRATLATASLPGRVGTLLEALLREVRQALDIPFDQALDALDQALFQLAGEAHAHDRQSSLLGAREALRRQRALLFPAFLREVEAGLAGIRGAGADHRRAGHRQLALVDDEQLEEDATLRDIAQRQEARASLHLHLLGQRFGVLARAPAFAPARLPLGPRAVANALLEACRCEAFGPEVRRLWCKAFDKAVMVRYADLAGRLDACLADAGVLPGLTHVPLRTRAARAHAPGDAPAPSRAQPAAAPAWTGPTAAPATEDPPADVAELFDLVRRLLAARPGMATHAPPGPTGPTGPTEPAAANGMPGRPGAEALPARAPLAEARFDAAAAVALVDLLLHEVLRAMRPDAPAHALVQRLRTPLRRLAGRDRSVLVSARHPARILLNAVAESGAPWAPEEEVDPHLAERLAGAVAAVEAAGQVDAAAFEAACRPVQAHLDQLARRAEISERRLVDAARGKARLAQARHQAAGAIADAVRGHPLPSFVQALIDHAWADALTLALLRHGEASAEWRERLADTAALAAIATGERPDVDSAALAGHVREALLQVGYHAEDARAIAARLAADVEGGADDPAARSALAQRLQARTRLGEGAPGAPAPAEAVPDEATRAAIDRLAALPAGNWFEVDLPGGRLARRRLSWCDAATGQALFVNLRGQRADEPSLQAVARQLAAGTMREVPGDAGTLVDRAWRDAIASMRAHLSGLA